MLIWLILSCRLRANRSLVHHLRPCRHVRSIPYLSSCRSTLRRPLLLSRCIANIPNYLHTDSIHRTSTHRYYSPHSRMYSNALQSNGMRVCFSMFDYHHYQLGQVLTCIRHAKWCFSKRVCHGSGRGTCSGRSCVFICS